MYFANKFKMAYIPIWIFFQQINSWNDDWDQRTLINSECLQLNQQNCLLNQSRLVCWTSNHILSNQQSFFLNLPWCYFIFNSTNWIVDSVNWQECLSSLAPTFFFKFIVLFSACKDLVYNSYQISIILYGIVSVFPNFQNFYGLMLEHY